MLESRPFQRADRQGVVTVGAGPQRTDSSVDAIAATVIITVVVLTVSLWLSGMPA